ncbi:hypothetical protein LTR16_010855, partial [Cryomyces antarcticus]
HGRVPLGAASHNTQPTTQTGHTPTPPDPPGRFSDPRGRAKGAAAREVVDLTADDENELAHARGGTDAHGFEPAPRPRQRRARTAATTGMGALRGTREPVAAVGRRKQPHPPRV